MDRVEFFQNQYCNNMLIHKINVPYECISADEEKYYIRQEGCPKGKNWCTGFPKECEGKLFKFVVE